MLNFLTKGETVNWLKNTLRNPVESYSTMILSIQEMSQNQGTDQISTIEKIIHVLNTALLNNHTASIMEQSKTTWMGQ